MKKSGRFTLVELLIVISIIAILASMLIPALKKAKESANRIYCLNNEKQYSLIFNSYLADNNSWWMYDSNVSAGDYRYWTLFLTRDNYAKRTEHSSYEIDIECPSLDMPGDCVQDYVINGVRSSYGGLLMGVNGKDGCRISQIRQPSKFVILLDRWDRFTNYSSSYNYYASFRPDSSSRCFAMLSEFDGTDGYARYGNPIAHNMGSNYLFADGHAEWLHYTEVKGEIIYLNPGSRSSQIID